MTNDEFEFTLEDRIAKIQAINEQWDLLNNSYVSDSGGLDSRVNSEILDIALPGNNIPRVYFNTGIEYKEMLDFMRERAKKDPRIVIINSGINIKNMLNDNGYPFKSKQHSHNLGIYQNQKDIIDCDDNDFIRSQGEDKVDIVEEYGEQREVKYKDYHIPLTLVRYLGVEETSTKFRCPNKLRFQFKKDYGLKVSDMCCYKLKKDVAVKYQKESGRTITITGMRKEEGGQRASIGCVITDKDNNLVKFHPLLVVSKEFELEFIKRYNVDICKLYKPPFNFDRTGCVACPYALNLQEELNRLYKYLPNEYYKAINIWKPVYDEYIRIGYRLKYYPHEKIEVNLDEILGLDNKGFINNEVERK